MDNYKIAYIVFGLVASFGIGMQGGDNVWVALVFAGILSLIVTFIFHMIKLSG